MKSMYFYDFPIGRIGISEEDGAVCRVSFGGEAAFPGFSLAETPLLRQAACELAEYFDRKRTAFEVPLALDGTPFQQSVWRTLQTIPVGETRTYQEIAVSIGNPKACRAVGMANNRNPLPILIPCHRVIGRDGRMVGYAGGISIKEYLLRLEGCLL